MKQVKFTDVFKDITGGNVKIKQSEYIEEGCFPIVDQGKKLINGYTNRKEIAKRNGSIIVFGDHTGVIKYVDFDFLLGADGVKVLQPDYNLIFPKFAFYVLQKIKIPSTGYDRKYKYLKRSIIPLPPLPEQKRIAAILDEADKIRQLNKKLIEHYEQLSQSLFLEMFGDPVLNPMGWEKFMFDKYLLKVDKISSKYGSNIIDYVDISSIDNIKNKVINSTKYSISDSPSRAQQILKTGDILFSTVRPNLKNIAINYSDNKIGSTGFHVIRLSNELLNIFAFELLKMDSVTDYFAGITSGANYPALKTKDILKFKIIVPPIALQTQFADRVQEIERQKEQAELSLQKSEELFQSLLQRAFRGEL